MRNKSITTVWDSIINYGNSNITHGLPLGFSRILSPGENIKYKYKIRTKILALTPMQVMISIQKNLKFFFYIIYVQINFIILRLQKKTEKAITFSIPKVMRSNALRASGSREMFYMG